MTDQNLDRLISGLRSSLLQIHKKLIDWAREQYSREVEPIENPYRFLSLLTTDPRFEWLRPLSEIIVRIDELESKKPIPTNAAVELRDLVLRTFEDESDPRRFAVRLADAMRSDPGLASDEAMIRMLAERLPSN